MEKSVLPKNQIFVLDDVITPELCKTIINVINNNKKKYKEEYGPGRHVLADSMFPETADDKNDAKKIKDDLKNVLASIRNRISIGYIHSSGFAEIQLRKIKGKTLHHLDGPVIVNSYNDYITAKQIRNMSIIIALNSDYEGGELCFPEQDFKIKLKQGQAIAFPPYWTHPHHTTELLNGTYRYTVNTWFYQ